MTDQTEQRLDELEKTAKELTRDIERLRDQLGIKPVDPAPLPSTGLDAFRHPKIE